MEIMEVHIPAGLCGLHVSRQQWMQEAGHKSD